jgi:hypothetical protein
LGDKLRNRMFAFDPATSSWSGLAFTGYTTDFETGASKLTVVANGIASAEVDVTVL